MERDTTEKGGNPTTLTTADRIAKLHNYIGEQISNVQDDIADLKGLLVMVNDQVTELQAAIADMQTAQGAASTRINAKVDKIEADLATAIANQTPPPDLSSEIQAIRDETTALTGLQPDTP